MFRSPPSFWIFLVLLFLSPAARGYAESVPPALGKVHPALVLWPIQGAEPISIDSYRGTKVLVIYFSTWSTKSHRHVTLWQEATKPWVAEKELVVLGVMLEQHRDRCRLFAQWKSLEIPLLHDPLNLAGIEKVPMVVGVDEHGIVRSVDPDPKNIAQDFVNRKFKSSGAVTRTHVMGLPRPKYTARMAEEARNAKGWREHGDALLLAGLPPQINEAILTYPRAIQLDPEDTLSRFRLGVGYRIRYDSVERQPGDFQAAIDAWREAVRGAPKNKVFRSRIQQYGIRHERGSMYRWIKTARSDLLARGETPVELAVEPAPIELAGPRKKFMSNSSTGPADENAEQVTRDSQDLVGFESVVVQGTRSKNKRYAQVLLIFRAKKGQHWHNGGKPLQVRVDRPKGVRVERRFIEYPNPESPSSDEERILNFEVGLRKKNPNSSVRIKGYATYELNEGGKPLRLRRDFEVKFALDLKE
ncbi:MAG: hypothetical protein MI923_19115 [Phycisphaerales bacterium]|nr:hypothetical protein [Phycisphaerales bacterium]